MFEEKAFSFSSSLLYRAGIIPNVDIPIVTSLMNQFLGAYLVVGRFVLAKPSFFV